MPTSDETLVKQAQKGDSSAFEEIVRRTSRLVYARIYLETGDRHLAEDLLQDTLLQAFHSLRQLSDPGHLRGWLLTIAQNLAIDASRRSSRLKRTPPAHPRELDAGRSPPNPAQEAERSELRQRVLAVLRSLPEEYRLPLTLRYLGGADYETIEQQLGLSNGSLRGLLFRGLKMLRSRLEGEFGPSD